MASTNKTSRLHLNQWLATDSPRRIDFNSDNSAIDSAFLTLENRVSANETAVGSTAEGVKTTLRGELADEVERLEAEIGETRRFAMDSYNTLLMENDGMNIAKLEPTATGVWVERFADLSDFDMSLGASNRVISNNGNGVSFLPQTGVRTLPLGTATQMGGNFAMVFELDKPATLTGLHFSMVWAENMYAFTQSLYHATRNDDGSITVGEQIHTQNNTSIPMSSFANSLNTSGIHLEPGLYCYVSGSGNQYYCSPVPSYNEATGMPPEYSQVFYTFDNSTHALTVKANYAPHLGVSWQYDDGSLPRMLTKLLDFGSPAAQAVVYVYSNTDDQVFQATAIDENGNSYAVTADPKCQHVAVSSNRYLSRYVIGLTAPVQKFKLDIRYGSAMNGSISRMVVATLRDTE